MSEFDLANLKKSIAKAEKWANKDDDDSPAEEQYRRELFASLKRLALDYAAAPPPRRLEIRALFDRAPTLARYLPSIGEVLSKETPDEETIRAALAMVSLNDLRSDWRDVQVSVGAILSSARNAGIDPHPLLREIAAMSSDQGRYDDISAKQFLEEFAS